VASLLTKPGRRTFTDIRVAAFSTKPYDEKYLVAAAEGTDHHLDSLAIANMKEGVMVINTSRGALIDTAAAIEGL
jgi:lactate dehydrogenase-like 2-hydroxyacid dehydrogenase